MRLPAAERREQLMEMALTVFAEQGYHAASMNDVADAAGVTKPVLYQHFSSKRELFVELLREIGTRLQTRIAKATADASTPREQIEMGFAAYFDFVGKNSDAFQVLFGSGAQRDPEFASYARGVEDSIARAIAQLFVVDGEPAEDQQLLAYSIVGMTEAASRHWLTQEPRGDIAEVGARIARLAWFGLRGIDNPENP
jgi:AcrR family transcriptional regulator